MFASAIGATPQTQNNSASQSALADKTLLLSIVSNQSDQLIAVGAHGHVLSGEATLQQQESHSRVLLTAVDVADGLALAVGHDAVILKHEGDVWVKQYEDIGEQRPLLDVLVLSSSEAIAVGAYGYVLKTEDAGQHWQMDFIHEDHDYHLNDIARHGNSLWIAAESGLVYRSIDKGKTWSILSTPYDGSYFAVQPLSEDAAIIGGLRGHVFITHDAGQSWQAVKLPNQHTITSFMPLNDDLVMATAHGGELYLINLADMAVSSHTLKERAAIQQGVVVNDRLYTVGESGLRQISLCELSFSAQLPQCGKRD